MFSNTLNNVEWDNTEIENGSLVENVNKLKGEKGKDIIVYGGSSFVSSLIAENLIDEYHFFINPVAIGKGIGIFNELNDFLKLKFIKSRIYESGIVYVSYANHEGNSN